MFSKHEYGYSRPSHDTDRSSCFMRQVGGSDKLTRMLCPLCLPSDPLWSVAHQATFVNFPILLLLAENECETIGTAAALPFFPWERKPKQLPHYYCSYCHHLLIHLLFHQLHRKAARWGEAVPVPDFDFWPSSYILWVMLEIDWMGRALPACAKPILFLS